MPTPVRTAVIATTGLVDGIMVLVAEQTPDVRRSESLLEQALRNRTRAKLVNEKAIPGLDVLLAQDPDLETLLSSLRPHARLMLLVTAELISDRPIHYMGRSELVYTSRLSIIPFDLASGQALGPGFDDKLEYNSLTVQRKCEELLRPRLRRILDATRAEE